MQTADRIEKGTRNRKQKILCLRDASVVHGPPAAAAVRGGASVRMDACMHGIEEVEDLMRVTSGDVSGDHSG
jgi:hypothetical protein